jgi:hypothetical protein
VKRGVESGKWKERKEERRKRQLDDGLCEVDG